jgi:ADP-ribosylglycohydrolase
MRDEAGRRRTTPDRLRLVKSATLTRSLETEAPSAGDRAAGGLLGLAAADLIGGPQQLACLLAASLLERRYHDRSAVLAAYLGWTGRFDTGPTMAAVLARIEAGEKPEQAAVTVHRLRRGETGGCGPAHRVAPLGLLPFVPDEALPGAARSEARLTHLHTDAAEAAVAVAVLLRGLVRGSGWHAAITRATRAARGPVRDACLLWRQAPGAPGGHAPVVLAAALHFAGTLDANRAIRAAITFDEDNYTAVLTGTFVGARDGCRALGAVFLPGQTVSALARATAAAIGQAWPASAP